MKPIVAPNRQGGRNCRNADGRQRAVQAPEFVQALGKQDSCDDVVSQQADQDAEQRHDHTATTELRPRLDHLRQAEFGALGGMERLKGRSQQDTQRPCERRVAESQAEAGSHETDSYREKMKIAQEPEWTLIHDPAVTLVFRDKFDGPALDIAQPRRGFRHADSPVCERMMDTAESTRPAARIQSSPSVVSEN